MVIRSAASSPVQRVLLDRPARASGNDSFAGAVEPLRLERPTLLKRVGATAKSVLKSAANLAQTVPAVVAAYPAGVAALARAAISQALFGGELWPRLEKDQRGFQELGAMVRNHFDGPLQQSLGLSINQLAEVDARMCELTRPQPDGSPCLLFQHFEAVRGDKSQAVVVLGPERQDLARWLERATKVLKGTDTALLGEILSSLHPPEGLSRDEVKTVLEFLLQRIEKGQPAVYVDLDGKLERPAVTESVAIQMVASSYRCDPNYFAWLNTRQRSYANTLGPWLEEHRPDVHRDMREMRSLLDQGGRKATDKAIEILNRSRTPEAQTDLVVSLDRQLFTGSQSYWVRLLRECTPEQRMEMLQKLTDVWGYDQSRIESRQPLSSLLFGLKTPPVLEEFNREKGYFESRPYDRSSALTETVDRTLNGLSLGQRKDFLNLIRAQLKERLPQFQERDRLLKEETEYPGVDWKRLVNGLGDESWRTAAAKLPVTGDAIRHRTLLEYVATLDTRYRDAQFRLTPNSGSVAAVSEFFPGLEARLPDHDVARKARFWGKPDGTPALPTTLVLEGGGGKGFAYPECLQQLEGALADKPGELAVDEFVGVSAGALTAGLLAAGFQGEDFRKAMGELDFMQFNGGYFQLQSGEDPKVRGLDRTGMFSLQSMYRQLYKVLGDKLGIHNRPITFRDLPYNLKICSLVVSTDLPQEHPLRKQIGPDGEIVFSPEATPDFDVVGCMVASAAVPLFFQSPSLHLAEIGPDGKQHRYRMQLIDGGLVDNLPVSLASGDLSVTLPVLYESGNTRLNTLSFDNSNVGAIDEANRHNYARLLPGLGGFLNQARQGHERLVLSLNFTKPEQQPAPIVQGRSRSDSQELVRTASRSGFQVMAAEDGASIIKDNLPQPNLLSLMFQNGVDKLLDAQNRFTPGFVRKYAPSLAEAPTGADIFGAFMAASYTAQQQWKGFEKI